MNAETVKKVLESHAKWLAGDVSGERADFAGADLRLLNLSGLDFRGAFMCGCDLRGSRFANCDFRGADLSYADFESASVKGSKFDGADLDGANGSFIKHFEGQDGLMCSTFCLEDVA